MIVGPPGTPYEFGFFEFNFKFKDNYPRVPPSVSAITTGGGVTRFNPNIYANGKVCLSILGTWRGERGEEWSPAQGLESVLLSIQSLMSSNPYENEPGFEEARGQYDQENQAGYVAKIRHETLRLSVIERLEDYFNIKSQAPKGALSVHKAEENDIGRADDVLFEPFKDLCKRRFLWYYDIYMHTIETEGKKHKDGTRFPKMPFEAPGNSMDGEYQYTKLKKRMQQLYAKAEEETASWVVKGLAAVKEDSSIANNLTRQFEQICETIKHNNTFSSIEISLVDKNPFLWELVLFGRPGTLLENGVFKIHIHISTRFPDVLPRVQIKTPIFHCRVTKGGVLCYESQRKEDMRSHIDAIVQTIEEENPAYDPRTMVNTEAAELFWGKPEERKIYNRKLRRSAQDSLE